MERLVGLVGVGVCEVDARPVGLKVDDADLDCAARDQRVEGCLVGYGHSGVVDVDAAAIVVARAASFAFL